MPEKRLRVILLTHGGAEKVLAQLCTLDCVEVVGVFVEVARTPQRTFPKRIKRSIRYDGFLSTCKKLLKPFATSKRGSTESGSQTQTLCVLKNIAESHRIHYYTVDDYHAADTITLLKSTNPDLAVGFGTNILKESVFGIPRLGTINFHNGLVPFYRGGPPVFWELFNDESEIGLTVHWMAEKVDAGDVIIQEKVPLTYDYSFGLDFDEFISNYRVRLSGKYAELVAEAVASIAKGEAPRMPQASNLGKRYRLPTKSEKDELRRRLKRRIAPARKTLETDQATR